MTEETDADAPYLLEVKGEQVSQIWKDLNLAVGIAIKQAIKAGRHGVLVTQYSTTHYTVALSEKVPYGQTHERRLTDA